MLEINNTANSNAVNSKLSSTGAVGAFNATSAEQADKAQAGEVFEKSSPPDDEISALKTQLAMLRQLKIEQDKAKAQPKDELEILREELAELQKKVEIKRIKDEINGLKTELGIAPEIKNASGAESRKASGPDVNTIINNASGVAGMILTGLKSKGMVDENGKLQSTDATTGTVIDLLNLIATQGQNGGGILNPPADAQANPDTQTNQA
ncbi:MAG: hypothetical protein AB2L14_06675 [Candidatus Xenobiia bacterium LiM19]